MKLTGKQIGIIIFTLITAFMHLAAAFDKQLFPDGPDPLFILNGLGYLGLLGAYFLPIPFFQQRHELVRRGYKVTQVLDRQYFRSIYFREPGGVLLEVATVAPGFAVDEPLTALGQELKLPPWEEPNRPAIEAGLPAVTVNAPGSR